MSLKTTFALLALVAGVGALIWKGDEWAVRAGFAPPARSAADSPTVAALSAHVAAGKITRIEMPAADPTEPFTLEPDGGDVGWKLPGNWPLRKPEVDELVGTLTGLRSAFDPIPAADADMPRYGLAAGQKPLVVTAVTHAGNTYTLRFGEPPAAPGENPFTRPAYLRVNDYPEVLRLGPDVLPVLRRPVDAYRRRQVFPDAERVKLAGRPADPFGGGGGGAVTTTVLGDKVATVSVSGPGTTVTLWGGTAPLPDGTFTLTRTAPLPQPVAAEKGADPSVSAVRLAGSWELTAPARDRVDPDKLKGVLAAVPDLWADEFVRPTDPRFAAATAGLAKPERTVSVTRTGGGAVTLELGGVAKTTTREEATPAPPSRPGMPPMPGGTRTITEEYRYARLAGNPTVFVVKADKFADLFARAGDLRDPRLARFESGDVKEVTVVRKGQPPVSLTRKKGDPKAADDADKRDRWYVARDGGPLLADDAKVDELLSQLSGLEAKGQQITTDAVLGPDATRVSVIVGEKKADDTPGPDKRWTFVVGTPDAAGKRLPVKVDGWDRVNLVDNADDKVSKLVDRPAVAYRGKRLFDVAAADLKGVKVTGGAGEAHTTFALQRDAAGAWKLSEPFPSDADAGKAGQLTGDLSRLEAVDYVADAPTPEELTKFGLDKPALSVALLFGGDAAKTETLTVGKGAEGKPDVYARLGGGSVFTVGKGVVDSLKAGAVALLPLQVWTLSPESVLKVDVQRPDGAYTLSRAGTDWALAGPFDAKVPFLQVQPLLTALAALKADKYEALAAPDPAAFGLDKPAVRVAVTFAPPLADSATATRTLAVGKPTPDGAGRYARLEGGPNGAVFVVPAAGVAEADKPALDRLDKTLLFLDPAAVTKVQVTGPTPADAVTLARDEKGNWKADGERFAVDAQAVAGLAEAAAHPRVIRLAGYGAKVKWADFGLDKPAHAVTVTVGGDKPAAHTVKLGTMIPDPTGGRFARIDDGPAVAVVAFDVAGALARGRLAYVDRTLLTFDPSALTGLSRKKGDAELEIEPGTTQGWNVVKPTTLKADTPLMEELADQLGRLRAVRVAAYGPKSVLKDFGLDAPAAVVTLKIGDKPDEKVIRLGKPDGGNKDAPRFAVVDGPGPDVTVGVLPGSLAKRLLADPTGFRDRTLAKFVDADKLTLVRGDRAVTFGKVDGSWKVVDPVAAEAEQADLDDFVNALAKLRADELVADKPKDLAPFGLDKPEAVWKAFDKGAEVLSLQVGTLDDGRAFAKLEKGDVVGRLDEALTGRVLGEYRRRKVWDGVDAAQAQSLVVNTADKTFHLRKLGGAWVDADKPDEAVDVQAVNETLDALAGLKAVRYAADTRADPKLYGLEKPERVVVLSQAGGVTKTLEIGREVGGSGGTQVYARVREPGRTDVFVVGGTDAARLTRDRAAFVGKK